MRAAACVVSPTWYPPSSTAAAEDPQPLTLVRKDLEKPGKRGLFLPGTHHQRAGGNAQQAILKDLQRHPAKNNVMHADFLRVDAKVALKVNVPIHFMNEETCKGVKLQGGIIQHQVTDIEVQCLPADIPEYIEVDMLEVSTGQIVHLSDVPCPKASPPWRWPWVRTTTWPWPP